MISLQSYNVVVIDPCPSWVIFVVNRCRLQGHTHRKLEYKCRELITASSSMCARLARIPMSPPESQQQRAVVPSVRWTQQSNQEPVDYWLLWFGSLFARSYVKTRVLSSFRSVFSENSLGWNVETWLHSCPLSSFPLSRLQWWRFRAGLRLLLLLHWSSGDGGESVKRYAKYVISSRSHSSNNNVRNVIIFLLH